MKLEERVNQEIRLWGLEILRLHKKGISPSEAVRQAYKRHPVFSLVRENIKAEMPKAAKRGYGKGELPEDTGDQLAKIPWSADGLNLSQRTTRGSKRVVAAVEKSLEDSISRGQSVKETAMAIFDGYSQGGIIPEQDISEFMKKLLEVAPARDYGGTEYKALLRKARRNIEKLNSRALKAAYNQIIDAIEDGNERLIEKAVHTATQEKTRYFAERIARTEMSRAYFDGFLAKYLDDPDVVAFKLHLSKSHPNTDICDLYAEADLFGMGKGIFPKDQLPDYPFHPNCMCRWEPIIRGSRKLKSENPKPQFKGSIDAYLKRLSNGSRQQLLGVNGAKEYAKTGKWEGTLKSWAEPKLQESRLPALGVDGGHESRDIIIEMKEKLSEQAMDAWIKKIESFPGTFEEWPNVPKPRTIEECALYANIKYRISSKPNINCQRSVVAYDMQRRGKNACAQDMLGNWEIDELANDLNAVYVNSETMYDLPGTGKIGVQTMLRNWGNGARAAVSVNWPGSPSGHLFVVEYIDGKFIYVDPQSGKIGKFAEDFFEKAELEHTSVTRLDNLKFKDSFIKKYCEPVVNEN